MNLTAIASLTVGGSIIYQSNMYMNANNVTLLPKSSIIPSSNSQPFCVQNAPISEFSFDCTTPGTEYSSISNNTISIVASKSIYINTAVTGSFIVLCSPVINIGSMAAISASGRGCASGHGMGAGQPASGSTGGGGGGNGGAGGSGIGSNNNGGGSLSGSNYFNAGSGGGAYSMSSNTYSRSAFVSKYSIDADNGPYGQNGTIYPTGGTGGGVIVLIGTQSVALNGNLLSNGGNGGSNCGGGAGGTIAVNTLVLRGVGTLEANGGSGGSDPYPGGGGGGGYITLYNSANVYIQQSTQTFTYIGTMEALGGNAFAGATSGTYGSLALPNCPPGYGNSASSSGVCMDPCNMCEICPVGTYNTGGNDLPCFSCNNKPTSSYYITLGEVSSNCPFNCYDGYSTLACTQFGYYLGIITVGGFASAIIGVFLLLFLPLLYFRLKYRYGWFESNDRSKKNDLLFDIFIKFTGGQDDGNNGESSETKDIASRDLAAIEQSGEKYGDKSQLRARGNMPTGRVERRKACRMSDQDLQNHACRINLLGSNSPFWFMGL